MYWEEEGRSKINKPWNRQGGGHIICSAYAGGGRGGVRCLSSVLTNALASRECRHPPPPPPLFIHFQNNSSLFNLDKSSKHYQKLVVVGS